MTDSTYCGFADCCNKAQSPACQIVEDFAHTDITPFLKSLDAMIAHHSYDKVQLKEEHQAEAAPAIGIALYEEDGQRRGFAFKTTTWCHYEDDTPTRAGYWHTD